MDLDLAPDLTNTTVRIDRSWWSWAGPHGGYVAGCLLDAAADAAPPGHSPRTLSVSFLEPVAEGEAAVRTRPLRASASSSVVLGEIGAPGAPSLVGTLTAAVDGLGSTSREMPAPPVPSPSEVPTIEPPADLAPYVRQLEYRPVGEHMPFGGGDTAELSGWMRFRDDRPVDAAALTILVDALPPALYAAVPAPIVIPTVDLQVVFSGEQREGGWVLGRIRTRNAWDGWCVEDSDIWSVDGRLLAQARQTRRVLDETR